MQQVVVSEVESAGILQMSVTRVRTGVKELVLERAAMLRAVLDSTHPLLQEVGMRMRSGLSAVLACVVSGLFVWAQDGPAASSDEARGKLWWAHVQYLADP